MDRILGKIILLCLLNVISFSVYAEWKCYAGDKGGHYWMSMGSTEERAAHIALNFCSAYSPNSGSCHKSKCFQKPA